MLSKHMLSLAVASCLLSACNDDDEAAATTTPPQTVTQTSTQTAAQMAYSGKTTDATISADNAAHFSRAAFAARDYAFSSASVESWLTQYVGAETITCIGGGKVAVERDIDITTMLGSKTLSFANNCSANGVALTGKMTVAVTAYDQDLSQATAIKLSYHDLTQHKNGQSITLNGSLGAVQDLSAKTVSLDIDTHMKADTGEETLTTIQVAISGNKEDRSASSTYSGKVCLKADGCVALTTHTPFKVDYNGYSVEGEMLASGADNTRFTVTSQDSSAFVKTALVE